MTTPHRARLAAVGLSAMGLVASVGLAGTAGFAAGSQATARTVYLSVLDEHGQRVNGLTAADLTVKDHGRKREIVSVALPSTRIRLVVLVEAAAVRDGSVRWGIPCQGRSRAQGLGMGVTAPTDGANVSPLSSTRRSVANDLSAQYLVTYVLPDGVEPFDRLEVKLDRPGGHLRAPTRIAK